MTSQKLSIEKGDIHESTRNSENQVKETIGAIGKKSGNQGYRKEKKIYLKVHNQPGKQYQKGDMDETKGYSGNQITMAIGVIGKIMAVSILGKKKKFFENFKTSQKRSIELGNVN